MKEKFIERSLESQTDKKKLHIVHDNDIDYTDIPATTADFWADAESYMPSQKTHVSMRLDNEIIQFFKQKGQGYQSRINAVLKAYVRNHSPLDKRHC